MAKILTTAIVADIRNKLNGSVFSKNKAGAYIRTKVTPVNPQTVAQQNVRNVLSSNSQAWRGLTQSQRDGWSAAAPNFPYTDIFGNIKQLSGMQLFVKLNNNLAVIGIARITNAPSPVALPSLTAVSVTAAHGTPAVDVVFAPTPIAANFEMVIETTPNVTAGKEFVKNLYRVVAVADAASTSPFDALSSFQALFGDPVAGNKIFVRIKLISKLTGQAGIPLAASCIVAA